MSSTTNMDGKSIIAQDGHEVNNDFASMLRRYETAYVSGDYSVELMELATATAYSVLKKCIDPQRKTAQERDTVSASGLSPALTAVKKGIMADQGTLESIRKCSNMASRITFNADGDAVVEVIDPDAAKAVNVLIADTLSDGLDLVNSAVVAILEVSADRADGQPGWMERPYTVRKLSRKVVIQSADSAKWIDEETSPIREVYRAIRRAVQNSRAVQTDPRNGYLYIEDTIADPDSTKEETIYHRLHKWADLGGYTHEGEYTADRQTLMDYNAVVEKLNLTSRQATIIRLRMSGYGYQAIGSYMGVTRNAVYNALLKVRAKCEAMGFTPGMWADMNEE